MTNCFFVSDLHGGRERYSKLFSLIEKETPVAVFLGGDLFPSGLAVRGDAKGIHGEFLQDVVASGFSELNYALGKNYPEVFVILGNDDGRFEESGVVKLEEVGIWHYIHQKRIPWRGYSVYGYCYIPPTPFMLKDWERYDVSRFVDPGCIAPEEGSHSSNVDEAEVKRATIQSDVEKLAGKENLSRAIFLFHTPPYETNLDRAALDGKYIDHTPLDVHVGSIAVRRFIESRQPLLTLHGHVHESARITGQWKDRIGRSYMFSAAHDGPELALVKFDLDNLNAAVRVLL
ncbi:MAG: Metallophos domain-containing protein [Bacteroidetes bacterium]|nr:Metallophos domain-containing protein [Bacteroidota bacterium]